MKTGKREREREKGIEEAKRWGDIMKKGVKEGGSKRRRKETSDRRKNGRKESGNE